MKNKKILVGMLLSGAMLLGGAVSFNSNVYQASAGNDANSIVLGNDNYIYGTDMEAWDDYYEYCYITLHVDIDSGNATSFNWQYADAFDSNSWTTIDVTGASGTVELGTKEIELTFIPTQDTWYRCVVSNNDDSVSTIPLMVLDRLSDNDRYYLTNGQMAYSIIDETRYDVIGKYNGEWISQTSYDGYWNFYTSSSLNPDRITDFSTDPTSVAHLEYIKCSFDPNNIFLLLFNNKLEESEHAFAISCDVKIRDNDEAPTTAVRDYADVLQQLQLVDTDGDLEDALDTDPAIVINCQECSPTYWGIEEWDERNVFDFNYYDESDSQEYVKADQRGVIYEINGEDSGVSASWVGLEGGDNIRFTYSIGTVLETGASLKATIASSEDSISITVDENTTIQVFPVGSDTPISLKQVPGSPHEFTPSEDSGSVTTIVATDGGTFKISGLPSNTKYTIVVSDENNNTIIQDAATNINPLTPEDPNVPEEEKPAISLVTNSHFEAINLNPNFSYNIQDENGINVFSTYQKPVDGKVSFEGLLPGTTYYFVAKSDVTNGSTKIEFMTDFAIEFNPNGGFPKPSTQYSSKDGTGKATMPSINPSKPQDDSGNTYGFDCWAYYDEELDQLVPWDFENDLVTENVTLYATYITKEPPVISLPTLSMEDYAYGSTPSVPQLSEPLASGVEGIYYCYNLFEEEEPFVWENITPTSLPAGPYCICLVIPETATYGSISTNIAYFEVTQAKDNEITGLSIEGWKYGETPNTPTANAKYGEVEFYYSTENSMSADWSRSVPSNVGTYWVLAHVKETSDYNEAITDAISFTISKGDPVYTSPVGKTVVYTGNPQDLITAGVSNNGTFTYSLEENGTYTTTIPTQTNVGTYTVYWKLTGRSNYNDASGSVVTKIRKANSISQVTIQGWNYGDTPNTPSATASFGTVTYSYSTSENGTYTSTVPTEVGTYWVKAEVAEDNNYLGVSSKASFTISKVNATYTAPTAKELTFNGSEQALVNAGSSDHGTFTYSLTQDGTYSSTIPTAKNVGSYTVYWKLTADGNHNDANGSVSVSIAKALVAKPVEDTNDFTFNGEDQTYTIANNDFYTITGNVQKEIGEHTVTVSLKDKTNTAWADGTTDDLSFTFVINAAPVNNNNNNCFVHWILIAVLVLGLAASAVTYFLKMKKLITLISSSAALLVSIIVAFFGGCGACVAFTIINILVFVGIDVFLEFPLIKEKVSAIFKKSKKDSKKQK